MPEAINTRPRVAVLMSVYNAETYLREAVESILNQTLRNFRFIIIDDGSTDSSLAILQHYERIDPRIRLVSRPNTGLVGALNEALSMADAEYVARMDADDVSRLDRFARQIAFLETNPEYVAVGSHSLWTDPDGLPLKVMPQFLTHEEIDSQLLQGRGNAITHAASLFRRTALLAIGGYRKEFETAEDLDLFLRLAERGRLANLKDVLYVYRQHPLSTNHLSAERQNAAIRKAIYDARCRRRLPTEFHLSRRTISAGNNLQLYQRWLVLAIEGNNMRTARKYARRLVFIRPLSKRSWRYFAKCYAPWLWRLWCILSQRLAKRTIAVRQRFGEQSES
jgi:glycosyltransferase involved in cell wall biosynthesis